MLPTAHLPNILMVSAQDSQTAWVGNIQRYLTGASYVLTYINDLEGARQILQTQPPDVILTADCACLEFLTQAYSPVDASQRPLFVLIADVMAEPDYIEAADLVLPPEPIYIEFQLRTFLNLRARNIGLQQEARELVAQTERLQRQLDVQKRSVDEVTLLKNAIVRNVSHELKTPLLHVKSATSLLAEDARKSKLTEYATGAVARLEAVVKNITQLADSLDIRTSPMLVSESLDQALRNLRRSWAHRENVSRVQVSLPAHLPPVLADRQGLGTVLQLLIDNGLKFSERPVEVKAELAGMYVRVSVRDYGIGIAQDQKEKIFDTFYQVDSSSTRRYGGTGVGLAIVRLIMERHHILVELDSKEGEGSTFWFLLPVADLSQDSVS